MSRLGKNLSASAILAALVLLQLVFLLHPLAALVLKSVWSPERGLSLAPFAAFLQTPGLAAASLNTVWISLAVTGITVPCAFAYAYALQRAAIPGRGLWRLIGLSPLLGPSLVGAIAFIQWFGNQGVLKSWLMGGSIYGPLGIILGTAFAAFPHALMILLVALAGADGRLYEASDALGASRWKRFVSVTLPGAKYGLLSASMVVFAYAVSEFGVPKVIGGNTPVLAVEIYIQAIGQQNFARGGMVALLLLIPVFISSVLERQLSQSQRSALGAKATPYRIRPEPWRDTGLLLCVLVIATVLLALLGMTAYTSLIKFWPYNLELTLHHYTYGLDDAGVGAAYGNSLKLALGTALLGTPLAFVGAYLTEKTRARQSLLKPLYQLLATLPMGVPGLALGIGCILVFNHPQHPLGWLYHTMPLLIAITIVHYFAATHVTAMTALKALDAEFEAISAALKVPQWRTFWRVTLPLCLPAILEIFRYYFINGMTTVSAVVFLYAPDTLPATVSILNLDEAGELGPAAAMATLIVLTNLLFGALHQWLSALLLRPQRAWRTRNN